MKAHKVLMWSNQLYLYSHMRENHYITQKKMLSWTKKGIIIEL